MLHEGDGITYPAWLIRQAHGHLKNFEPLPTTLFADMLAEGLDVEGIEREFHDNYTVGENE